MNRLISLLAIVLTFAACNKSEQLVIGFANEYDQTVILSGLADEYTIKPGKTYPLAFFEAHGNKMHLDIQDSWNTCFYSKFNTITVYSEDRTVLDSWTKEELDIPGNPFVFSNWRKDDDMETGIDGGITEGLAYTFLVDAYSRTNYSVIFVLAPRGE